ncbi:MAG: hypothetical protein JWO49_1120 [Arthrobacter sp.]|jgi:hypothetical protein|nr:hypothetical protein [Arthrobacter sp.]
MSRQGRVVKTAAKLGPGVLVRGHRSRPTCALDL